MFNWVLVLLHFLRLGRWKIGLILSLWLSLGVWIVYDYSSIRAQSGAGVTFIEVASQRGIVIDTYSWGLAWRDFNNDGFIDLYSNNHSQGPALFRNNGGQSFTNITGQSGLLDDDLHGPAWADYDNDGDADLFQSVGNEHADFFYRNDGGNPLLANIAPALGINFLDSGRGVAWADYNRDGHLDFFVTNLSNGGFSSELYKNQGNGTFVRKTQEAGLFGNGISGEGQIWADYNRDGWPDLLVWLPDRLSLFRNNGNGTFTNQNSILGDVLKKNIRQADWIDYDNDSDLDFFIARSYRQDGVTWDNNEIKWITGGPSPQVGFDFKLNSANSSVLFDIHDLCGSVPTNKIFIGASKTNPNSSTFTLSSASTPNPNGQPNYNRGANKGIFIWLDGSGVWHLRASDQRSSGVVSTGNSFNQVTSSGLEVDPAPRLREKQLWENVGGETFVNVTNQAGVADSFRQAKGAVWADFDNDGDLDLYLVNTGHFVDNERDTYLVNNGDKTFTDATELAGLAAMPDGHGDVAAAADYNGDGFLDLAVANGSAEPGPCGGPVQLYENQGNSNHWVELKTVGTVSNRDAVGAAITLTAGGKTQYRQQFGGQHQNAQDSPLVHFGLGQATIVQSLVITWPSGLVETHSNLPVDQIITLVEGAGPPPIPTPTPTPTLTPPTPGSNAKLTFLPMVVKGN